MKSELLPCPFCGGKSLAFVVDHDEDRSVECEGCGANGPHAYGHKGRYLPDTPEWKAIQAEAARLWNTRTA